MGLYCGFGDLKHLKPINEERIDFLNSWIVKYILNHNLCESNQVHRLHGNIFLQGAYKCPHGESIEFNDYAEEERDLCLCWTSQAVDPLNKTWNTHYAKGEQIRRGSRCYTFKIHFTQPV